LIKLRKQGISTPRLPRAGLRFAPRQLTIMPNMLGMIAKVKSGKSYFNVYFESSTLGLKVGALTHTRAKSPIDISSKNRFGDGFPSKGLRKLKMGAADKKARKIRKKKKKIMSYSTHPKALRLGRSQNWLNNTPSFTSWYFERTIVSYLQGIILSADALYFFKRIRN